MHTRTRRRWSITAALAAMLLLVGAVPASAAASATQAPASVVRVAAENAPRECQEGSLDIKDASGLCAERFKSLSLDRGDAWTFNKMVDAWFYDKGWSLHYSGVQSSNDTIDYVYKFEWMRWMGDLVDPLARSFKSMLDQVGVIPLAMGLSAAVYGFRLFRRGRSGALLSLMMIGVMFTLLGYFATPAKYIYGQDGFFPKVQSLGNEMVAAATASDDEIYVPGSETVKPANEVLLQDTVGPQITESVLRDPYEVISFGKRLEGQCKATFEEAMRDPQALRPDNNFVRDKVAACDSEAKAYINNPVQRVPVFIGAMFMGAMYQLLIWGLVAILFALGLYCAFKLVMCILQIFKALWPGADTTGLMNNIVHIFMYLGFTGISGLILAFIFRVIGMGLSATGKLPEIKYTLVGYLLIISLVLLFFMLKRLNKAARDTARRLRNALERGKASTPGTGPQFINRGLSYAKAWASRTLSSTVGNRLGNTPRTDTAADSNQSPTTSPVTNSGTPTGTNPTSGESGNTNEPTPGPTNTDPGTSAPIHTPALPGEDTQEGHAADAPPSRLSPRSAALKASLMAAAARTPAGAAAIAATTRARMGLETAQGGARRVRSAAMDAHHKARDFADPEKRHTAKAAALRERLSEAQRRANAAEAAKEHAAQVKEAKKTESTRKRLLSNEISTQRANAPHFDAEHEQKQREAQTRIQQAPTRQKRKMEVLNAKAERSEFARDRAAQARKRAQEIVAARMAQQRAQAKEDHVPTEPVVKP